MAQPSKRRRWTSAEEWTLLGLLERHMPFAEAGRELGRSASSCRTRADRLGSGGVRTAAGDLSAHGASRLLGVDDHTIGRWIHEGHLRGARTGLRYARGFMVAISRGAIEAFLADEAHWHRFDPARISEPGLQAWATALRGGRYFLRLHQVEKRTHFAFNTAGGAVRSGRLRAVRDGRGPWLVRDDWLADMQKPPRRLQVVWRLKSEQRAEIVAAWGQEPVVALARRIGVGPKAVHRAARKLGLPPLGRGRWSAIAIRTRRRVPAA